MFRNTLAYVALILALFIIYGEFYINYAKPYMTKVLPHLRIRLAALPAWEIIIATSFFWFHFLTFCEDYVECAAFAYFILICASITPYHYCDGPGRTMTFPVLVYAIYTFFVIAPRIQFFAEADLPSWNTLVLDFYLFVWMLSAIDILNKSLSHIYVKFVEYIGKFDDMKKVQNNNHNQQSGTTNIQNGGGSAVSKNHRNAGSSSRIPPRPPLLPRETAISDSHRRVIRSCFSSRVPPPPPPLPREIAIIDMQRRILRSYCGLPHGPPSRPPPPPKGPKGSAVSPNNHRMIQAAAPPSLPKKRGRLVSHHH